MKINYPILAAVLLGAASISFAQARSGAASDIRKVDFKNFNYGALCPGTHKFLAPTGKRLVLRNGHQEHGDNSNYADLGPVTYVDFDRDRRDEAFVIVKGQTSGSSGGYLSAYVFAYKNGRARQIWSKCEESSTAELKGRQVVFASPQWLKNDAHCCFSYISTGTYGWKGSGISLLLTRRQKSSETGSSSETETIEQLAARVSKAFMSRDLRALDATKPYGAQVGLVVEHSLGAKSETKKFKRLKDAGLWLMKRRKDANLNAGELESCKNSVCAYVIEGLLHNNLYLKKITYGLTNGRPYLKSIHFLDGD